MNDRILCLLQERDLALESIRKDVKEIFGDDGEEEDREGEAVPTLTECQLRNLFLSTIYQVDGFPLVDFLEEEYGFYGEWDGAMLSIIRGMALLRQVEIENHLVHLVSSSSSGSGDCEVGEGGEERVMMEAFKKRKKSKGDKKLVELLVVRHLELALLLGLLLGEQLEQVESDFVVEREVEFWSESLSIHYAIDVTPSPAFLEYVERHSDHDKNPLIRIIVESCGLDVSLGASSDGSSDHDGEADKDESTEAIEPTAPIQPLQCSQAVMSPLTLNSHWSRLKSKTLRRRSTDTDLSKLVELPPMPSRLSQTSTTHNNHHNINNSQSTPKRKGVLVHVGDLENNDQNGNQLLPIVAFETPVKLKRTMSSSQASGIEASLVILETPPRASIGANMSIGCPGGISKFTVQD